MTRVNIGPEVETPLQDFGHGAAALCFSTTARKLASQESCLWEWAVGLGMHMALVVVVPNRFGTTWLTIRTPTQLPRWLALVGSGSNAMAIVAIHKSINGD